MQMQMVANTESDRFPFDGHRERDEAVRITHERPAGSPASASAHRRTGSTPNRPAVARPPKAALRFVPNVTVLRPVVVIRTPNGSARADDAVVPAATGKARRPRRARETGAPASGGCASHTTGGSGRNAPRRIIRPADLSDISGATAPAKTDRTHDRGPQHHASGRAARPRWSACLADRTRKSRPARRGTRAQRVTGHAGD